LLTIIEDIVNAEKVMLGIQTVDKGVRQYLVHHVPTMPNVKKTKYAG
jgi:hypothetical protein